MERKIVFETGEYYHVYNRGVNKYKIFFSPNDWMHFQKLLFSANSTISIQTPRGVSSNIHIPLSETDRRGDTLVDIVAYAQMENHYHLILREKQESGISKFMLKFGTAFTMYMNKKYDRTGPLMTRPFRAKHVDSDEYFRWLISYVHLNPLDQVFPKWKESGGVDVKKAKDFLDNYKFSSYIDYFGEKRVERLILNKEALPISIKDLESIKQMLSELQDL